MADTLTLYSDISNSAIQTFYDNVLLRRAHPYEVHANFAQQRPIPSGIGNQILFRRYEHLDLATTPLTEAQSPDGSKLSKTDITATIKQYGDFVQISDVVDLTARDPVLTEAAEVLGEQMGRTRDVLVRDQVVGEYFDNKGSGNYTNVVDGGGDTLTQTDLEDLVDKLLTSNARFLTSVIRPSTGYNTTPIRQAFVAIMNTSLRSVIEGMSDFVPISEYPSNENIMDGEWGAVKNVRILLSTLADSGDDIDSGGNYVIPIFGADAYGVTELASGAATNIVKAHGSGGTGDPLNQRATSGWKIFMTSAILNPKFMGIVHNVTG